MYINTMNVLVVGDVMLDQYTTGLVTRISPEAPVPVLKEKTETFSVGGAGNLALNLAHATADVFLFGCVGDDEAGKKIRSLLAPSVQFINLSSQYPTIVKNRIVNQNGAQICRVDYEEFFSFEPDDYEAFLSTVSPFLDKADLIVFSDYAKGLLSKGFVQDIIDRCKHMETGPLILADGKDDPSLFKGADLIKPNLKELSQWVGSHIESDTDLFTAMESIRKRFNIKDVVCTLGARGVACVIDGKGVVIPSKASQVFDVSGAGDTFLAYLAFGLWKANSLKDAVALANDAAGVAVSKRGTSVVSLDEIQRGDFAVASWAAFEQRRKGKRVVFTNGCFDILHKGHIQLLREAKKLGDILVVGLNSDDSVRRLKGNSRPVNRCEDRKAVLEALSDVDYVFVFSEDTPESLIERIRPDVLTKGGDYQLDQIAGAAFVRSYGGTVMVLNYLEGYSTSSIIGRAKND